MNTSESLQERRLQVAQLVSSVGAGVLGVGLGALLSSHLLGLGLPILALGILMHAWGMFDRHRLETHAEVTRPWWATAFYWLCWAMLLLLGAAVVARSL